MPPGEVDPHEARGSLVFDVRGEEIGRIVDVFELKGQVMNYVVALDDTIASLPEIGRDVLRVAPKYLTRTREGEVRMNMTLMDAVRGEAPPPGFGGA